MFSAAFLAVAGAAVTGPTGPTGPVGGLGPTGPTGPLDGNQLLSGAAVPDPSLGDDGDVYITTNEYCIRFDPQITDRYGYAHNEIYAYERDISLYEKREDIGLVRFLKRVE